MNMKIGAMNNPKKNILEEIDFVAQHFDFLDLTIEPGCYVNEIDVTKVNKLIKKHGLHVVGHTAWNLPIASVFEKVRLAATNEYMDALAVFKKLGITLVNIHPHMAQGAADPEQIITLNITSLKSIVAQAKKLGITIMMENTKGLFNEPEIIGKILEEVPGLKLHWDVGHANLGNEGEMKTKLVFSHFANKIVHMHFSDNNGAEDQHLPIGTGNINWPFIVKTLKEFKYNKTITLEVHAPDISYLVFSKDKIKFILETVEEIQNDA